VQKLINGQKEMNMGIDEAISILDEFTSMTEKTKPISFVAPDLVSPDTVQFIIRTPDIEVVATPTTGEDAEDSQTNFWQRLMNLFVNQAKTQ
jgi:hypothetical protein